MSIISFNSLVSKFEYNGSIGFELISAFDRVNLSYHNLVIDGYCKDEQVCKLLKSMNNFTIKYEANNKEELIDYICGNTWPEFMEEFLTKIIEELTVNGK